MCGINGFTWNDKALLKAMNAALAHRGPDDSGTYSDARVSLGHQRLAIIDISAAGHQPMTYTHGKRTVTIVFNGEIYNYKELKTELIAKGYTFTSESDTEVILASYLAWGYDCVTRFNGMWAFTIYDKEKELLLCSRDRAGEKPFYYYNHKGVFIFSSELKGILAHKKLRINTAHNIDREALQLYLSIGYVPSPRSIFQHVSKLEPRQNLIYDLKARRIAKRWYYYTLPAYAPEYDREKLLKEGKELFKQAVASRMIADVPVGAFLSGGLDSSAVVAEMAQLTQASKLHTFSIGFEGKYDETPYITIVKDAFKTKHHHAYFKQNDFEKLIDEYSIMYDEPFADYSGFPTRFVSTLARKHVTVALSGDGGDELFGGYPTHRTGHQMDIIRSMPSVLRKIGKHLPARKNLNGTTSLYGLKKAFELSLEKPESFYAKAFAEDTYRPLIYQQLTEERLAECLKLGDGSIGEALRLYDLLYNTLPDNYLVKVDRASMAVSLEVRAPFLDHRLMEFSQRLPATWKADAFAMKKFMREIIKDIVPQEIINRGKKGFTPPIDQWIQDTKYDPVIERGVQTLETLDSEAAHFYRRTLAEKNSLNTLYRIRLFLFQLWYEQWVHA